MLDLMPAFCLFAVLILALAQSYLKGNGRDQYLVVTPPTWSFAKTINLVTSADGRLVATGRLPNMLFVASTRVDFEPSARAAGAWIVMPVSASWGCYGAAEARGQG
jgi:hypothetical protein